ncbi:hypothetical protein C8R43DRAFT_1243837 [Mycena crocata]|nr:hypothetical protein C8R43DRAFT_1243837 [Mycena crocata]
MERTAPSFSLHEFGDLVSAAFDLPASAFSPSASPTSLFPSFAFSAGRDARLRPYHWHGDEAITGSKAGRQKSLRTMFLRFKRRAGALVGSGSKSGPPTPTATADPMPARRRSRWGFIREAGRTNCSKSSYRISELRLSAHVAPGEVALIPLALQRELDADCTNLKQSPDDLSSSSCSSMTSLYPCSSLMSSDSHSSYESSSLSPTTASTSSNSDLSSASSDCHAIPLNHASEKADVRARRRSTSSSASTGPCGAKPSHSTPCVAFNIPRRRFSFASAAIPNPHPPPTYPLPPLPLSSRNTAGVESTVSFSHPYATAIPLLVPEILDAFPLPPALPASLSHAPKKNKVRSFHLPTFTSWVSPLPTPPPSPTSPAAKMSYRI